MAEVTINGKRVVLKDVLRGRDGWRVIELFQEAQAKEEIRETYDANRELVSLVVESWEFDGEPSDPASYDALDTFREFQPLNRAVAEHVMNMLPSKN